MSRNSLFTSEGIINASIADKEYIYILYTGVNAKRIFFVLLQNKIKVSGFVISNPVVESEIYGLKLFTIEETDEDNPAYVADPAQWDSFKEKIDEEKIFFVDEEYQSSEFTFVENGKAVKCNGALTVTMILSRVEKKQPVFLVRPEDYEFWENLINVLKNRVQDALIISLDSESEKIYELLYYDLEKIIIFVCIFDHKNISELLLGLGLKQTYHFALIGNSFSGHITDKYHGFDWYLGNTFVQKEQYPGFYIYEDEKSVKKLVILGNSATDPLFYPQKTWAEMLWENYAAKKKDIAVYNGAVADYNSTNEVIKLFRDVLLLQPDIVVSYSGIIDFRKYVVDYPYLNLNLMRTSAKWEETSNKEAVYGLVDYRSAYERWLENEKIMWQICNMHNITFYGILQPWLGSDRKNSWEKLQIWSNYYWQIEFPQFDDYIDNAKEFKKRIRQDVKKNDWLYDFTDIFEEIDDSDIYYDSIHVNERGNMIVANKMSQIIKIGGGQN